jgi:Fe-S cluster assembly ATP-binding protein
MASLLNIKDLHVSVEGKQILKGINLTVRQGEIHAIMGPNGSGKSTLAYAIAGHPKYHIESGEVWVDEQNILDLDPSERARLGIFLAFQYPVAIPGVSMANFLRTAVNAVKGQGKSIPVAEFRKTLTAKMALLKMDKSFASRYLNDGFSGGEKKRAEILQMAMLEPKFAILDEPDSGLDIDALRIVAEGVNALAGPHLGSVIITHYQRILNYIKPDVVHVLAYGHIIESGGADLAKLLEVEGYDRLLKEHQAVVEGS